MDGQPESVNRQPELVGRPRELVEGNVNGERILVIDDDAQSLALISRFLRRAGYEVETIADGGEAIERLRHESTLEEDGLALVLSDLKMPDIDGLRILDEVKEYCPDAVFVLITGYATTDSAVAALRQGVYDYLTKPLDLDDLLSTVQRALEHRALVMQNKRLIEFLREKNVVLEFLHREEQRKSEQLRQVNAIARQITPILDVETLIATVLDLIVPSFDFVAPSFGTVEGEELTFSGGRLDGRRMPVQESVFWKLTGGGRQPFIRLYPGEGGREDDVELAPGSQAGLDAGAPAPYDLIFPLNKAAQDGERTVGFWVADWDEAAEFREENLPYLESLAAQTVVVLENARLYAVAKQVDELAFLNEVGRAANESLDLEKTIHAVLACVQRAFDASLVEIALLDREQEVGQAYNLIDGVFQPSEHPLLGRRFVHRVNEQPVIDERVAQTGPLLLRSLLGVPLRFGERSIGVMGMGSVAPAAYTAEHGRLIQIAGGQVATAIQNARLFQEVESAQLVVLQSRNTLRTLVDGILEGIYIVDRSNVILAINRMQAGLADKPFAELVGHPAELAFPSSERSMELIRETFRTGKPMSCTERQRIELAPEPVQQAGSLVPRWTEWEIHTYPITNSDAHPETANGLAMDHAYPVLRSPGGNGRPEPAAVDPLQVERVVVVVRDVTDQRLLEASLVQSEKMAAIGTLAAGFAHEINNPMTVISANAQILSEEISGRHPYYGSIELIDRASQRASKIVRNLLDFSRSEEFEFVPTDLNLSLKEAIALVETQLRKANVQLVCELESHVPPVWASPDHLHVVWLNLLLNARDAIEEKREEGTIQVTSHRRDDQIIVRIADTGVGMPDEMLKHLFEPFFTTKGPGKGTGLGLFTCYRTLIRHGGEIRVDSLEGEGTVFRIALPIRREPAMWA